MQTYMRSNDAFIGMPHDIFAFTMLQEIMAGDLGVGLGTYKHCVGSLHIYEENLPKVRKYLDEGWQSTKVMMPPMSKRSQWPYIAQVLELEQKIRLGEQVDISSVAIDNYWADITRLLQIYALKPGQARKLIQIKNEMASPVYEEYIRKKERRVHSAKQQQLPL
jgi:thymidylate synthase